MINVRAFNLVITSRRILPSLPVCAKYIAHERLQFTIAVTIILPNLSKQPLLRPENNNHAFTLILRWAARNRFSGVQLLMKKKEKFCRSHRSSPFHSPWWSCRFVLARSGPRMSELLLVRHLRWWDLRSRFNDDTREHRVIVCKSESGDQTKRIRIDARRWPRP